MLGSKCYLLGCIVVGGFGFPVVERGVVVAGGGVVVAADVGAIVVACGVVVVEGG